MDKDESPAEKQAKDYVNSILSEFYSDKTPENDKDRYSISFFVDKNGIVDIEILWPESIEEVMSDSIASLLYSINNGEMKSLVTKAMSEPGIEDPQLRVFIMSVIEKWVQIQNSVAKKPYINPRETLR